MPQKLLAGYWHNFVNTAGVLPLVSVPDEYDIVNVAFATPAAGSTAAITFAVFDEDHRSQFTAGIAALQRKQKKVLLSIGGSDATVQLHNREDVTTFVKSVAGLIEKYGFDGIDIDFENHSLFLDPGDTDLFNPTTPVVANLIFALRLLHAHFGPRFIITLAPETFFVQHGFRSYGSDRLVSDNRAGCTLPVMASLHDIITYLWVQQYNSGPIKALDGRIYRAGDRDFNVALTEMLLTGFSIASDRGGFFDPFNADQLLIGVPANEYAGRGYLDPGAVRQVLTYLAKGEGFGGTYKLLCPNGYSGLRGVMLWSINWDEYGGRQMSKCVRNCLDALELMSREAVTCDPRVR